MSQSRMSCFVQVSAFLCLATLAILPLHAQEVTGNILGRITDATSSVVANATVTVTNTDQGVILRKLQTDATGDYAATLLPTGMYSVTVEAPGFKRTTETGIELTANQK